MGFLAVWLVPMLMPAPAVAGMLQAGDILVADVAFGMPGEGAVFKVDPATGDRTVISSASVGSGPLFNPMGITLDDAGRILVSDVVENRILRIDPLTGDRIVVSGAGMGSGEPLSDPKGIALAPNGELLVAHGVFGFAESSIISINLDTGDRTVVSGAMVGTGSETFREATGLALETSTSILVTDGFPSALVRVDLPTGNRSIVTAPDVAGGVPVSLIGNVNIDRESETILITALTEDLLAVLQVDGATGERTIFSSSGVGSGPLFVGPIGLAILGSGEVLVTDFELDSIFTIDPITRDRSILSGPGVGAGDPFTDPTFMFVVPIPEPSTGMLLLIGLLSALIVFGKRSFSKKSNP